jgi:membrane protein YdbS with pleckstrin-like domain
MSKAEQNGIDFTFHRGSLALSPHDPHGCGCLPGKRRSTPEEYHRECEKCGLAPSLPPPRSRANWHHSANVKTNPSDAAILAIRQPHPNLFTYYWLALLVFPPLLPILILPAWFRYHTMRYKFTDEGISMSWGILFRREIIVNYARIQDIHLRSNFVERWLGLARVLVQTASGNAGAELTLEGLQEFEAVRDFLYTRMRGVRDHAHPSATTATAGASSLPGAGPDAELAAALREVASELREVRLALAARPAASPRKDPADV